MASDGDVGGQNAHVVLVSNGRPPHRPRHWLHMHLKWVNCVRAAGTGGAKVGQRCPVPAPVSLPSTDFDMVMSGL